MSNKNNKFPPKLFVPVIALALDAACVPLFFLGVFSMISGWIIAIFGIFLTLVAICCPFGAIITAITALCLGKQQIGKSGVAMSVIAMVIPIIAVIVTVILFSTGVAYIRFM